MFGFCLVLVVFPNVVGGVVSFGWDRVWRA
jgi:hypothetical protein